MTKLKPLLSLVNSINIDAQDQYGRTSLHRAVMKSEEAIKEGINEQAAADSILKIMANGASLDILDETFRTPFEYARSGTLSNVLASITSGYILDEKKADEVETKFLAYLHSNRRSKELATLSHKSIESQATIDRKNEVLKYDRALKVYVVISALSIFSASFTLGLIGFVASLGIHAICGLALYKCGQLVKSNLIEQTKGFA